MDVTSLFDPRVENTGGRPRQDYRLTRYAAYLVAMNGAVLFLCLTTKWYLTSNFTATSKTYWGRPQKVQAVTSAFVASDGG